MAAVVLYVRFATPIAWPWYTVIGSLTTLIVGATLAVVIPSVARDLGGVSQPNDN